MQLESLIAKGIEEARKSIQAKRKERALLYLRKNKLYDHSVSKIDDYLLNVEQVSIIHCSDTLCIFVVSVKQSFNNSLPLIQPIGVLALLSGSFPMGN